MRPRAEARDIQAALTRYEMTYIPPSQHAIPFMNEDQLRSRFGTARIIPVHMALSALDGFLRAHGIDDDIAHHPHRREVRAYLETVLGPEAREILHTQNKLSKNTLAAVSYAHFTLSAHSEAEGHVEFASSTRQRASILMGHLSGNNGGAPYKELTHVDDKLAVVALFETEALATLNEVTQL